MSRPVTLWMVQGIRAGISAGVFSALGLYLVLLVSFGHLFDSTPGYALALLLFLTHSAVLFGCLGLAAGLFWWLVHSATRRSIKAEPAAALCVATCFPLAGAFFAECWIVFGLLPSMDTSTWLASLAVGVAALVLIWILSRAPLRRTMLALVPSTKGTLAVLVLAAIGTAVGAGIKVDRLTKLSDHAMEPVAAIKWESDLDLASAVRATREMAGAREPAVDLGEAVRRARTRREGAEAGRGEPDVEGRGEAGAMGPQGRAGPSGPKGEAARPPVPEGGKQKADFVNVLLLTVDTQRADHLGCYGYPRNTSPAVDSLAACGALFLKAYAQRPKTSPSFASILTSTYPQQHGIRRTKQVLPDAAYTMAEMFKDLGYRTCGVITNGNLFPAFNFNQGFDEYLFGHTNAQSGAELAIKWLSENRERPFFLWVHHTDPHTPYKPPPPYDRLFVGGERAGASGPGADAGSGGPGAATAPAGAAGTPVRPLKVIKRGTTGGVLQSLLVDGPLDLDYYISQYDGEVAYTDRWNGQLLSALRAMGLSRNTLVVFTADHGESLGEHEYYFEHGLFTYDASARIPLIMSLPGLVDEGRRDDQVVESVDILPTILDLVGAEVPSSCQGGSCAGRVARSLAGRLSWDGEMLRPAGRGKGYAYIEAGYGHHSGPGYTFAMTDGRYKLIIRDAAWVLRPRNLLWYMYSVNTLFEGGAGAPELYDLVADPGERVNVYGRRPAEKVLLSGDLRDFMKKTRDAGTMQRQPGEKALDEQTVRALRALGYVH